MKLTVLVHRVDGSKTLEEVEKPAGFHPLARAVGASAARQCNERRAGVVKIEMHPVGNQQPLCVTDPKVEVMAASVWQTIWTESAVILNGMVSQ